LGFRWNVGNGKKVKFWEDNWLGSSSLAIQFWDLYVIVNEKNKTIHDLWDGENLKCSFRRTVDQSLMNDWLELKQLAETISFSDEEDALVWMFSSRGVYSSQSLYRIINFRGVFPVHVSAVWNLTIPPRVHFFLWLLSRKKNLTRDVIESRGKKLDDNSCLFCSERETSHHLFFDCVVARQVWLAISELLDTDIGVNFESVGSKWLSNKKFFILNMITSATLWCIWKLRNDLHFQNKRWRDLGTLLMKIAGTVQNWTILCPGSLKDRLKTLVATLKLIASRPGRITG